MANLNILVFIILAVSKVQAQKKAGDPCTDDFTGSGGVCTPADKCRSANIDFQKHGVRATFCEYNAHGNSLVCCRDGGNTLQAATNASTEDPRQDLGTVGGNNKRVCERKCEEYSRGVIEKVPYIMLLADPERSFITDAKCDYAGVELIVGGEDAKRGEFPHMTAVGWDNVDGGYSFLCGGSLVSPKFVLTAAHCLYFGDPSVQDPAPAIVRLGDQNIDSNVDDGAEPVDISIRKAIRHPEYKPLLKDHDIALLELETDVEFRAAVRPACLWTRPDFGPHNKGIATGWGVIDPVSREVSKELKKVSLSLLDTEYCDRQLISIRNRFWKGFSDGQMCAGELRGGRDTCQGDSGSPLQVASKANQCIFYVVGVTSFGKQCAISGRPAVYTRVSSYLPWIESVVWPNQ